MKTVIGVPCVFALTLLIAQTLMAQQPTPKPTIAAIEAPSTTAQRAGGDVEAITQLENDSVTADFAHDASFYDNLIADDWTKDTSSGWITRASYLVHKKDTENKTISEKLSDLKVRVNGDVAVANYTLDYEDVFHGEHIVRTVIYTDVFQKRNGAWKMIASHASRLQK